MTKFNTIYSAYYSTGGTYPFEVLAAHEDAAVKVEDLDNASTDDALVIWGGSDINPEFYKHPRSKTTNTYDARDKAEWALLKRAIERGMTIIGVCRGAQMLCAAAGGFLLQDVQKHHGYHDVMTSLGTTVEVNSIHHQMMAGFEKVGHEMLAWCDSPRGEKYIYKADELFPIPEGWVEPEYVYFTDIKGHAIQWHPEGMGRNSEATRFVLDSIKER